ncbi:MAG: hypothetical protein IKN79_08380 [Eubacterium sp.]|nr:hypothetical protein [Eubacterium sp.]
MTDRRISQMSGPKAFLPVGYRLRRMAATDIDAATDTAKVNSAAAKEAAG